MKPFFLSYVNLSFFLRAHGCSSTRNLLKVVSEPMWWATPTHETRNVNYLQLIAHATFFFSLFFPLCNCSCNPKRFLIGMMKEFIAHIAHAIIRKGLKSLISLYCLCNSLLSISFYSCSYMCNFITINYEATYSFV